MSIAISIGQLLLFGILNRGMGRSTDIELVEEQRKEAERDHRTSQEVSKPKEKEDRKEEKSHRK